MELRGNGGLADEADIGEEAASSGMPQTGHVFRDALRLRFILVRGAEPSGESTVHDYDRVFRGEKWAQAIDFLVRYPDYLADSLLDLYEAEGDASVLKAARQIFADDAPSLRTVKMIRWRRGAYEDMQTSLSVLNCRGLVTPVRRDLGPGSVRHDFLSGYERQTALALLASGGESGSALKKSHYAYDDYASTPYGTWFPSIRDRVLERLTEIEQGGPDG